MARVQIENYHNGTNLQPSVHLMFFLWGLVLKKPKCLQTFTYTTPHQLQHVPFKAFCSKKVEAEARLSFQFYAR